MSHIKKLCEKIHNTFFKSLQSEASVLMLGNLYLLLEDKDKELSNKKKSQLEETLQFVRKKLNKKAVKILWQQSILFLSTTQRKISSGEHLNAVNCLIKKMLEDVKYFGSLPYKKLIALGQNLEWYSHVLIAILKKHLNDKGLVDPFNEGFDVELLGSLEREQSANYLAPFVNAMVSFPIEPIVKLGKNNVKFAEYILKDFSNSFVFYEISYHLAPFINNELLKFIAQTWKDRLTTFPHTIQQKEIVAKFLRKLSKKYPEEFKSVNLEGYVQRAYPMGGSLIFNKTFEAATTCKNFLIGSLSVLSGAFLGKFGWVALRSPFILAASSTSRFVALQCIETACLTPAASTAAAAVTSSTATVVIAAISPYFLPAAVAGIGCATVFPLIKKAFDTPSHSSTRVTP